MGEVVSLARLSLSALPNEPFGRAASRARAFVIRHRWALIRSQWTSFAPDQPSQWKREEFGEFVASRRWIFARTMPQNPHEYTLRRDGTHELFDEAVRFVRQHGVVEFFRERPYKMLSLGSYEYWTMGAPLCATLLINRKTIAGELVRDHGLSDVAVGRAKWEEALDRVDCRFDEDDFDYLARVLLEAGWKVGRRRYLRLQDHVYWVTEHHRRIDRLYRAKLCAATG